MYSLFLECNKSGILHTFDLVCVPINHSTLNKIWGLWSYNGLEILELSLHVSIRSKIKEKSITVNPFLDRDIKVNCNNVKMTQWYLSEKRSGQILKKKKRKIPSTLDGKQ